MATFLYLAIAAAGVAAESSSTLKGPGPAETDSEVIRCLANGMSWTILLDAGKVEYTYLMLGSKPVLEKAETFSPGEQVFPKDLPVDQCSTRSAMSLNFQVVSSVITKAESPLKRFLAAYATAMKSTPALVALFAKTAPLEPGKKVPSSITKALTAGELENLASLIK